MLNHSDKNLIAEQTMRLMKVLSGLDRDEQELIQALFFNGISVWAYAKQLGVRLNTVQYHRDKLLKKSVKKIFLNLLVNFYFFGMGGEGI